MSRIQDVAAVTIVPLSNTTPGWRNDVIRQLAGGRLDHVRRLLVSVDARDPAARLADVDTRMREFDATVVEIEELREELRATLPASSPLHVWADAVLADGLVLYGDPAGFTFAASAAAALDDRVFLPGPALFARGRLYRAVSCGWLLLPAPLGWREHRARRDAAILDFNRGGLLEEATFTRVSARGLHAMINAEDVLEAYEILVDTRTRILMAETSQAAVALDCLLAYVAYDVGDVDTGTTAARRVRRLNPSGSPPALVADFVLTLADVMQEGPSAGTDALEQVLTDCARAFPANVHAAYAWAAEVLASVGHPAGPRVLRLSVDHPAAMPARGVRELLGQWVALADGEALAADDVMVHVRALADDGRRRMGARFALGIGGDLARAGRHDDARRLHIEAIDLLPPSHRRTGTEQAGIERLARALETGVDRWPTPAAPIGGATVHRLRAPQRAALEVRVLAPALEVTLDGEPVSLPPLLAKLLVALVLAHPSPLHIEAAMDRLWLVPPGENPRRRLNMVVLRLRRALDGAERIRRRDEMLVLDPAGWAVDLHRFRADMEGPPDRQAAALTAVRGNLCGAQFPYDEWLVDERHRFSATWLERARGLIDAGVVRVERLVDAAAVLDFDVDEVAR